MLHGWALAELGQAETGIAQIRQGLSAWRATGAELFLPYFLALRAEALTKAGQTDEGLRVVAEALTLGDNYGQRWWEAELLRLQGECLLAQADHEQACLEVEHCFQQALEVTRRQQAKSLELRAVLSLSRLWQRQGKQEAARRLLAERYGWFTEGFETADLQEARTLLAALA